MFDFLMNGSDSWSNFLETSYFVNVVAFLIAITVLMFPIVYGIYYAFFSSKRLKDINKRLEFLEYFFEQLSDCVDVDAFKAYCDAKYKGGEDK